MASQDTTLSTHIEELRAVLDRLSRVGDKRRDEAVDAAVESTRHSIGAVLQIPAVDARSGPVETLHVRHTETTVVERLLSWAIGPFCRCPYCGTLGARLERDAEARRSWRCRCCRRRRRPMVP